MEPIFIVILPLKILVIYSTMELKKTAGVPRVVIIGGGFGGINLAKN